MFLGTDPTVAPFGEAEFCYGIQVTLKHAVARIGVVTGKARRKKLDLRGFNPIMATEFENKVTTAFLSWRDTHFTETFVNVVFPCDNHLLLSNHGDLSCLEDVGHSLMLSLSFLSPERIDCSKLVSSSIRVIGFSFPALLA